jgi:hypothetical protein
VACYSSTGSSCCCVAKYKESGEQFAVRAPLRDQESCGAIAAGKSPSKSERPLYIFPKQAHYAVEDKNSTLEVTLEPCSPVLVSRCLRAFNGARVGPWATNSGDSVFFSRLLLESVVEYVTRQSSRIAYQRSIIRSTLTWKTFLVGFSTFQHDKLRCQRHYVVFCCRSPRLGRHSPHIMVL